MNQNLLGGREYTPKMDVLVQILDIDLSKKIVDMREVQSETFAAFKDHPNNNHQQMSQKPLSATDVSASILLVKDCYSVVKVKQTNIIGFLWNSTSFLQSDQSVEFGR